jgi:pilus assembly protein FimV
MVGIQRLNPQAFVNGNINRLKAGSVIRLPTRDQISISERQAIGEVAKHNRAWKQGDDSLISTADVQLDATSSDDASGESYSEGARLSIASSGESDNSGFADGEGSDSNGGSALNDALASAQEDLDKTTMENQELQSRLSDMEAKLATMQRLIELKDDQLAAIQADGAVDNNVDTDVEAVDQQILAEDSSVDNQVADLTAEQQAEEVTVAEDKPEVSVEAEPAKAPEESLLDQLKNNPMYAGGAGLFILAIAALLLMRKRKDKQEEEQDDLFDEPEIGAFKEFDEPAEEDEAQPLEDVVEEDSTDQLVAELESQIAADNAKEEAEVAESPVAESTSVESETGDVIAEADIYVAYGRYQQAIDLLRTAAEQEPERTDVQLKLLEVYVETRDKPAFQQQYKVLAGLGNASAIEQVKEMLSTVDGVSDWLDGISDDSSSFTDEDMDADLIEGEAVAEPSIEMDDVSLDLDEDLELDDDLDLDLDEAASEDLELDLDSELDLDELNDESIEQLSDTDIEAQLDEDDAFNLDEDLSLDETSDSDDFDADKTTMFTASDLQAEMDETVVDSLDEDLDLDDLSVETEEDSATVGESNLDEGFDLDLDDDMDLGALDDTDLGELESEFGDTNSEPESLGESDEFIADDLDQEFDLDELSDSVSELDAEPSEDDEFDLDLVSSEDSDTTAEYSLDEATAGLATAGLATAGAVAASDQQELSDIVDSDDAVSDDDFDFLADTDEVATKLDLARAYIDMGDTEGAKDILDEVLAEGDEQQIQEANSLVEKMD